MHRAHNKFPSRADRVTVDGSRCISATRTIIDLAHARIPAVRLEAMIDSAVRLGLTAPLVLEKRLSELRGATYSSTLCRPRGRGDRDQGTQLVA